MKRTRWLCSCALVSALVACGPVRIGTGNNDGGTGGGGAGGGGSVGTTPVAIPWPPIARTKLDLLLMIDNSTSMADKQVFLSTAVPALVQRLTSPVCLDAVTGQPTGQHSSNGVCPEGSQPEFGPPLDMHIGMIDSSLGSHGVAGICDDSSPGAPADSRGNSKAHLITTGLAEIPSSGFLSWAAGDSSSQSLGALGNMVAGMGQHGCGYESQLESIYRFLVDPDPPDQVTVAQDERIGSQVIVQQGVDMALLEQRAAFLRPDSLVVVMLLSDEDDCSLQEQGQAWVALALPQQDQRTLLRPGTSVCQTNPNDPCCFNCAQQAAPPGCPSPDQDPACKKDGQDVYISGADDPSNLRCWRQKQRYGIDFLYPVQRYIDGFSQPMITSRFGEVVPNPLFQGCTGASCTLARDPGSFLFTAIVGVPWQDVAKDPLDPSKGFLTSSSLENAWPTILGDPTSSPPVAPGDPLMIDSVAPRVSMNTTNPAGASAIPVANVNAPPSANPINGHEWDTSKLFPQAKSDLQFACVFDLPTPRDCNAATDCDCFDTKRIGGSSPSDYKSPLCQDPSGAYSTTQYRAKAYPGLRELQVVKGLGPRGIAASICPAVTTGDTTSPAYGYNPVVTTMLERIRPHLPQR